MNELRNVNLFTTSDVKCHSSCVILHARSSNLYMVTDAVVNISLPSDSVVGVTHP